MRDHKIEIYIKDLEPEYFQGMLKEFFKRNRAHATSETYIRFKFAYKNTGDGYADVKYKDFEIVEASKNKNIWFIPLATINMQKYPSQLVVFIEGIVGKEKDWKKVENIVQEIISQMKIMKFEIESIKPEDLSPQSLLPPWEQIKDHASDRQILKLWHEGFTSNEIGQRLGLAPRSVTNIISTLRTSYSTKVVPTNEQRRKKRQPKIDDSA